MNLLSRQEAIASGLKRYFTGVPCRNGHIAERYALKSSCVECERERLADYVKSDGREAKLNRVNKWRKASRDEIRAKEQAAHLKDPRRRKARRAVSAALARGALVRTPCVVCGNPEVQGHHPDYDRPLEVVWLCVLDHDQLNREAESYATA